MVWPASLEKLHNILIRFTGSCNLVTFGKQSLSFSLECILSSNLQKLLAREHFDFLSFGQKVSFLLYM